MYAHPSTLAGSEEDQEDQLIDDGKRYDDSQIVFTAVEAFKYFTQVYSRVLSSTRPYQALTIRYNNPNDLSEKLSLSTNSSFPILPAKNQLLVEPGQSPAHRKRETDSLIKSVETKNFPTAPSTPPTPSRLLLPGYSPPLRPPAGLQVGKGWGDLHPRTLQSPPPLLYCILSTRTPPISFLLFIKICPPKFSIFTLSVNCLSRQLECTLVTFITKLTSLPL